MGDGQHSDINWHQSAPDVNDAQFAYPWLQHQLFCNDYAAWAFIWHVAQKLIFDVVFCQTVLSKASTSCCCMLNLAEDDM